MTIGDMQSQGSTPGFITQLQGAQSYLTPVLQYLQNQGSNLPQLDRNSLPGLVIHANSFTPPKTSVNTTPITKSSLPSNGKLVENYLSTHQNPGGPQEGAGVP